MTSIQPIEPSTTLIPEKKTAKSQVKTILIAALVILAPMVIGAAGGNYWVRVLDFAMLYVMLALGLNVVVGFAGLLDLGYIAFYAVGAYVAALLSSPQLTSQFDLDRAPCARRTPRAVPDHRALRDGAGRALRRAARCADACGCAAITSLS